MDFRDPPELEAWRQRVRTFFAQEMAPERTRGQRDERDLTGYSEALERAHLRRAGAAGLLGVSLPEQYGGLGKPKTYGAVVSFEAAYHDAPAIDTAVTLVAAPLLAFGSEEQKVYFLPRMARGEVTMCIAYTEPGAGSDLAALTTRADADGDEFVINGEKALVTGAHKADYCCLLARTDPRASAHKGMSMFLVDMKRPGIAVRRRETMNGWTLSDVIFQDARVPRSTLLGQLHNGWSQVAAALDAERSGQAYYGWATRNLDDLVAFCKTNALNGRPLLQDPRVRKRLAQLRIELSVGRRFARRVMWMQSAGKPLAYEAAMNKVWATELLQRIAHAGTQIMGLYGGLERGSPSAPIGGRMCWEYKQRVADTIGVGTNEIQRTTIALRGLGLPRG